MILNQEIFYAKILLFGEYSVIQGSMALSAPYGHFRGELSFIGEDKYTDYDFALESNHMLENYLKALIQENDGIYRIIDLKSFEKDIAQGLYFESTIPQGFGLGSSGALTAAVYSRYGLNRVWNVRRLNRQDISLLKADLARLEKYFHGTSSGFDPLSAYLKFPVLVEGSEIIRMVGIPRNRDYGTAGIFLVSSGAPRKTGDLVARYMTRCKEDSGFYKRLNNEYIPLNNACITAIIDGNIKDFIRNLVAISIFQLQEFTPMIPESLMPIWKTGIESKEYYLKLCGAGGGGYLLGFAKDLNMVLRKFADRGLETVTVYRSSQERIRPDELE
jgi:mevalonate kinase